MLNTLRFIAVGVAILLFVALVPLLFMSFAFPGEIVLSRFEMVVFNLGVPSALSVGYVFVFICGERLLCYVMLRIVAGALLSFPIAAAAFPLLTGHPEFKFVAIPLLAFSLLLFSAFAFPAWLKSANHQLQRPPSAPLT